MTAVSLVPSTYKTVPVRHRILLDLMVLGPTVSLKVACALPGPCTAEVLDRPEVLSIEADERSRVVDRSFDALSRCGVVMEQLRRLAACRSLREVC